jgi:tetratricopeptide (TPR) repeat protein
MNERDLFIAALQKQGAAERQAYLDEACGADPALRERVQGLLRVYERAGSFLERPAAPPGESDRGPTEDQAETQVMPAAAVGPYKLLQPIGEGGMGTVYMAEQVRPVRRHVAMKIIKAGMDSRHVVARFEAERQALALMDHPNIAKVLDAGTTAEGRPYFVMELVKGVPITRYCDEHRLTPPQRLELFVPVCRAVQHAHQKGIIHPDLKPSNVLIARYDGRPVPKVIDFGVAKATGPKLTERTLFTEFGSVVGTLEYMSPEQAQLNQLDVDTRSDIYSLGVLLYELLTGTTPLDRRRLKETALLEALRLIREEEPPRPSTRLGTTEELPSIAANRGVEPKKLSGLVRGELDWVVMKALEKERSRRYETASSLARDLERYLKDEPVQACPPSAAYRFRKFARRNKRALATAALLGVILLAAVGAVAGSLGWVARDRAARHAALAGQVTEAVSEARQLVADDLLYEAKTAAKRAKGLLATGEGGAELRGRVEQLENDLNMLERLEQIRLAQAAVLTASFATSGADSEYARAFRKYDIDIKRLGPDEVVERVRASAIRVELAVALDNWAGARKAADKRLGSDWKGLLALARRADPDPLRNRLRRALERKDTKALAELAREENTHTLPPTSLVLLAQQLRRAGQDRQAIDLLRQVRRYYPRDFWINHELALSLEDTKPTQLDEVIRYYTAAVTLRPQSPGAHLNLGHALVRKPALDEAIAEYRTALRLAPHFVLAHNNLGLVLIHKGKVDEAIAHIRTAIELAPRFASAHNNLGLALDKKGKLEKAIASYRKAIELEPLLPQAHLNLGNALCDKRQWGAALASYRRAVQLKPDYARAYNGLGQAHQQKGKLDEAVASYCKAIELDPHFFPAHCNLGNALRRQKKLDEAIASYRQAIKTRPDDAGAYNGLGILFLLDKGQPDEAVSWFQKAVEREPNFAPAHYNLGNALRQQKKLDAAIASYRRAIRLKPDYAWAYVNLGRALADKGQPDDALAYFRQAVRLKPDYALAHFSLGKTLNRLGWLAEAEAEFRVVIRLQPDYPDARGTLAGVLSAQDKWEEAIAVAKEAVRRRPRVPDANKDLAWLLTVCPEPALRDPQRAEAAARLLVDEIRQMPREDWGWDWQILGWAYYRAGDWGSSITALEKSMALEGSSKGGNAGHWSVLAMAHWQLGHKDTARQCYDRAADWIGRHVMSEDTRRFHTEAAVLLDVPGIGRGRFHAERGRWERAAADFARGFERQPPRDPAAWFEHACLLLQVGDTAGYRALCSRMVERFGKTRKPREVGLLAHACVLAPGGLADATQALRLARRWLAMTPATSGHHADAVYLVGLAHYRAGWHEIALQGLRQGLREEPDWEERVLSWLVLAMTDHRLGHDGEVRTWFDKAEQWLREKTPRHREKGARCAPPGWQWRDWLAVQLVHREAQELLSKKNGR